MLKKRPTLHLQSGVTLLEVLIFMTILSVIILAIVYATTLSLKQTRFNQQKIFATRYSEEVEQWMRGEKETDWSVFLARSPGSYCMNTDLSWDENSACLSTDYSLEGFKRDVVLTSSGTRVDVLITTAWIDGPNSYDVQVNSSFSRWE